ncbi:unnamed protein product [Gadus morhua 'NCC']
MGPSAGLGFDAGFDRGPGPQSHFLTSMYLAGPDHAPLVAFSGAYPGQVMLASPSHQMLAWEHSHPLENCLSSSISSVSAIIPPTSPPVSRRNGFWELSPNKVSLSLRCLGVQGDGDVLRVSAVGEAVGADMSPTPVPSPPGPRVCSHSHLPARRLMAQTPPPPPPPPTPPPPPPPREPPIQLGSPWIPAQ